MEFDFSKLSGRMVEKFGSRAACAEAAGLSEHGMYNRLNNRVDFSLPEIYALCSSDCLDIADNEVTTYFFTPKVR